MDINIDNWQSIDHIWPMFRTPAEEAQALAQHIKHRRLGSGWTQADIAKRAGVSYRTWRRLENEGKASIEDLIRAAIALRCEEGLQALFPEPVAQNMDDLLAQQKAQALAAPKKRLRAPSRKRSQ